MPPLKITELAPKGKQGQDVAYSDIYPTLGLAGIDSFFGAGDLFASYTYGGKGKPKDLTVQGTADDELLTTGDGNDTIYMQGGNDIVVAGGGDDTIHAGTGNNIVDGGDGVDGYVMAFDYGNDVDLMAGTMTDDGGGGDLLFNIENVFGNNKDNVIIGDEGANYISTGTGTDTVLGGGGNDTLDAATQTGSKTFSGGAGDDTIFAGADADEFYWASGDGADTVYYFDTSDGASGDTLYLDLNGFVEDADLQTGIIEQMIADGYLSVSSSGGTTTILVDANGEGAFDAASSITLVGTYSAVDLEGNILDGELLLA